MTRMLVQKKIKICQVCAVDFTFEYFLNQLILKQKKIGWDVTCLSSKGKYLNYLNRIGFKVKAINIARDYNIIDKFNTIILFYNYFKKEKFDIIHTHTPLASMLVRIACLFIKKSKVVYTAHGFYFHENMNYFSYNFFLFIEKFLSLFTKLTFIQSKEDYKIANKKFYNKQNIFCIGNGINLKRFNPKKVIKKNIKKIQKKYGLNNDLFIVGMICRLVEEKGVIEFLEASYLFSKEEKNFKAILIGKRIKNEHSKSIQKKINQYKRLMGSKLIITGEVKNVEDYLKLFSVFCLPSYREGLPRSIIEAMSMKLPVITTNIRGCRELIKNNINGFIVPIKNSRSIYYKIKMLNKFENVRKKMGFINFKKVKLFHNEDKIVNKQNVLISKLYHD